MFTNILYIILYVILGKLSPQLISLTHFPIFPKVWFRH